MIRLTILLTILAFMLSCNLNKEWDEKYDAEQDRISKYVAELKQQYGDENIKELGIDGFKDKVYFVDLSEVPNILGLKPQLGDFIIFDFLEYDTYDNLRLTNVYSFADEWDNYQANKENIDHYLFKPNKMAFGFSLIGFNRGLSEMHEGDSALFVVPSQIAYGDDNFTTMVYYVKLEAVIPDVVDYDSVQKDHFISLYDLDSLSSGIYYRELNFVSPDSGNLIQSSDSLYVNFSASYLQQYELIQFDTTLIDVIIPKSELEDFNVTGLIDFTKGFSYALDTMRIGSEAYVLVPYEKGFGTTGYRHEINDYIIVPRYTSLFYHIKVADRK